MVKYTNILETSGSVMRTISEYVEFERNNDGNAPLNSFWDLETIGIKPEKEQSVIEMKFLKIKIKVLNLRKKCMRSACDLKLKSCLINE